ncbi:MULTISPECIES: CHAT domain-containing protein [Serratia]|uniref:CHAT domain-containing protein n=1 Tax=Serratia TaxID=613 RepID=UPI0014616610|nr:MULTISPECIES: CHAT domain-containing protein [Serratia]MBH2704723.1 CHAT domain-containing protein [Serratia marcescens]MBH3190680.1 CHAT domain-containing protein [Serratia marcescens]NMQ38977.1 CHAT domain-containing protein [Serratia marcescens]SMP46170.1 SIR2-like domain-containing protein [Serratia sp. CC22-02]
MKGYAELEIVFQRNSLDEFQASFRQRFDESENITPFIPLALNIHDPTFYSGNPQRMGRLLSDSLFMPPALRDAFTSARAFSGHQQSPLKIRLLIDSNASILHSLPWETLVDPSDPATHLLRSNQCVFSRYLAARTYRLPMLRPKQGIKALLAIANPQDLSETFPSINVPHEQELAENALRHVPLATLTRRGSATLQAIIEGIKEGADILYLMCHGIVGQQGAVLWLEDEAGNAASVTGEDFAARLGALERIPSLVVLCSCQSAGAGNPARDALVALGPMLAKEGVPAVLAMQGKLSMSAATQFIPEFFRQLAEHGEVDRATAGARAKIMDSPDWWIPVVFTRLNNARIWYPPGFGVSAENKDPWTQIVNNIDTRYSTPILGPSMNEALFGSRRELASEWGDIYHYPLGGHDVAGLPQIAQYLAVTRQDDYPCQEFYKYVYERILEKYPDDVPDRLKGLDQMEIYTSLGELVSVVGQKIRARTPLDPLRILAGYKLPVYITTDPSDLLVDALKEQNTTPTVRLLRWNIHAEICDTDYVSRAPVGLADKGTETHPIVLKLFGDLSTPESLVLTEDDFFDYLTKVSSAQDAIPLYVRARLNSSALLFVGLQAESWEFRVLFRSLLLLEGHDLRKNIEHFSVQIDPNSILDPGSARRYIEKYLQTKAQWRLYWGDVTTFMAELNTRTRKKS